MILESLSVRIAKEVADSADPKTMYEAALAQVAPKSHTSKWILLKKLVREDFNGRTEEDCLSWIAKKEEQLVTLGDMGLTLPDEILVLAVIGGLPSEFNGLIKDYATRDDLKIQDVKAVVKVFFAEGRKIASTHPPTGLIGRAATKSRVCDFCNLENHRAKFCMINPESKKPSVHMMRRVLDGSLKRKVSDAGN
eukprot:TRINITY_DN8537_c0_g1_i1.p1 TRINITY_DN8537_c0_g1~~TRINITY_DN8537_c0_g1_i1.p1  ORF type:complete len:194 (+),score=56.11 TRINITY_DN8537_c0_g1_i1:291-872(+)